MDAWIQFAQYLNLTELVVLAEALIRRYGYAIEQFTQRLTAFHRVIGRARCEAALKLVKPSDSVQETRTRLALMLFGLPIPQTQYGITDSENGYTYTVDMAYPQYKVAIEYDGDHHRRFRKQYVRDQQKRRRLRQLGWTVIEVFADDLWNTAKQRAFAQEVATAMQIPLPGRPQPSCRVLIDGSLPSMRAKGNTGGGNKQNTTKHHNIDQIRSCDRSSWGGNLPMGRFEEIVKPRN